MYSVHAGDQTVTFHRMTLSSCSQRFAGRDDRVTEQYAARTSSNLDVLGTQLPNRSLSTQPVSQVCSEIHVDVRRLASERYAEAGAYLCRGVVPVPLHYKRKIGLMKGEKT